MRALKIATIVMAVLIVGGTSLLIVVIARRLSAPAITAANPLTAVLHEPQGTRIVGVTAVRDTLAVRLQGGGEDRVVLIDPVTGAVTGRVSLVR